MLREDNLEDKKFLPLWNFNERSFLTWSQPDLFQMWWARTEKSTILSHAALVSGWNYHLGYWHSEISFYVSDCH